jgi:hypothetical protein
MAPPFIMAETNFLQLKNRARRPESGQATEDIDLLSGIALT